MSSPINAFSNFLALSPVIKYEDLYEVRIENNSSGQPLYIGYTITPNAPTSDAVWFIKCINYTGSYVSWVQLPNLGYGYLYVWDNRATYF
jgi:hypothetical protein